MIDRNNEPAFSHYSLNTDTYNYFEPKSFTWAALNVCGLRRKILYPDFCDLVSKFELFCVCETKLDESDIFEVPGYTFISQVRKEKCLRKSGGIGVFVKSALSEKVTFIDSDSDYVLWIKVDKSAVNTNEDLFCGIVYVPPSDSRFYSADEFSRFDAEITSMCIEHKYLLLTGDFNARTQNIADFVDSGDFLTRHFEYDDSLLAFYDTSNVFNKCPHISAERTSQDTILNNEGKLLLDICKSNNLLILNGRCRNDKGKGTLTFRNCLILDYSIVSQEIIHYVQDFYVQELDPIYSDGHSLICTTLQFKCIPSPQRVPLVNHKTNKMPKWKAEKSQQFINNLNKTKINDLHKYLQYMELNLNSVTKESVTDTCHKIADIFTEAHELTQRNKHHSLAEHPNSPTQ